MIGDRGLPASSALLGGRRRAGPFAALDVGGGKVCCLIGTPRPDGAFGLLGVGHRVTRGFRNGEVVDLHGVQASILAAVHEAEQAAGMTLRRVALVTAAGRPASVAALQESPIDGRAVSGRDVTRLLAAAHAGAMGDGFEVLHSVASRIRLDGGRPVREPRGLRGRRLEVQSLVIRTPSDALRRLIDCVAGCHLEVETAIAAPYAGGLACLTQEEAETGALFLDMGADSTGVAVFSGGRLHGLATVDVGGAHVTQDLAAGLGTSRFHAERLKTLCGCAVRRASDANRRVLVPRIGDGGDVERGDEARSRLTDIIRPRLRETFDLIQDRLRRMPSLPKLTVHSPVVLSGGASEIDGLCELAEEMFGMPARLGRPACAVNSNGEVNSPPSFAAAAGALALTAGKDGGLSFQDGRHAEMSLSRWSKLSQWFREIF